jgi:hypothetical protein
MAFQAGFQGRILVGSYSLSTNTRNAAPTSVSDMIDVTCLGDATAAGCSKKFIVGQDTSTWTMDGVLDVDTTANLQFAQLNTWKTTEVPVSFAPRGFGLGNEMVMANALQTNWTAQTTPTTATEWTMAAQTDGATDLFGVSLHDLTAETATVNGTEVDTGVVGGSSAGANLNLHVTAFSGFTNTIITVEHSTTSGGTYNTLATFTTVTGLTSQRLSVAGTVRRYLRIVNTKTGTGSVTFVVGLGRI